MPRAYDAVSDTRPMRPVGPVVTSVSLIAVTSMNLPSVVSRSNMSSRKRSLRTISWKRGEDFS